MSVSKKLHLPRQCMQLADKTVDDGAKFRMPEAAQISRVQLDIIGAKLKHCA